MFEPVHKSIVQDSKISIGYKRYSIPKFTQYSKVSPQKKRKCVVPLNIERVHTGNTNSKSYTIHYNRVLTINQTASYSIANTVFSESMAHICYALCILVCVTMTVIVLTP